MKLSKDEMKIIRRTFVDDNVFDDRKIYSYYKLCEWFLDEEIAENSLIASQIEIYLKERLSEKGLSVISYKFGLEDGFLHSDVDTMSKFGMFKKQLDETLLVAKAQLNNSSKLESISITYKIQKLNFEIECLEDEIRRKEKTLEELKKVKKGNLIDDLLFIELAKKLKFSPNAMKFIIDNHIVSIKRFVSMSQETIAWAKDMDNKTFNELIEKQEEIKNLFSL